MCCWGNTERLQQKWLTASSALQSKRLIPSKPPNPAAMDLSGGPATVRDSKRDLISVEAMSAATLSSPGGGGSRRQPKLPPFLRTTSPTIMAVGIAAIILILSLMIALIVVCEKYRQTSSPPPPEAVTADAAAAEICLTPGCIGTRACTSKKKQRYKSRVWHVLPLLDTKKFPLRSKVLQSLAHFSVLFSLERKSAFI